MRMTDKELAEAIKAAKDWAEAEEHLKELYSRTDTDPEKIPDLERWVEDWCDDVLGEEAN